MSGDAKNFWDQHDVEDFLASVPVTEALWKERLLVKAAARLYGGRQFRTGRPSPPSLTADEVWKLLNQTGTPVRTRQALRNRLYMWMAWAILQSAPDAEQRYWWLFVENGRRRRTLLAELGRLRDPKIVHWAAGELCEAQPRTVVGIKWLREQVKPRLKEAG